MKHMVGLQFQRKHGSLVATCFPPGSVVGVPVPLHTGLSTGLFVLLYNMVGRFQDQVFHESCQFLNVWAPNWSSVISPVF